MGDVDGDVDKDGVWGSMMGEGDRFILPLAFMLPITY